MANGGPIALVHWLLLLPAAVLGTTLATSFGGYVVLAVDRGKPVQWSARVISLYVREACARALFFTLGPLGWGGARPRQQAVKASGPRRIPVLFVPSDRRNRASFLFLRTFLGSRGWSWSHAVNAPRGDPSLEVRAEALREAVRDLKQQSRAPHIDLVAHGTGGLVAAWYLRHLDDDGMVRRLVTIGTPWRGTRMAVFRRGRLAEELLYEAPVLDGLAPLDVPVLAIWSPDDPAVIPSSSGLPDGAESVQVESAGHDEMLVSARVFRAVEAGLTAPGHDA